MGKTLKVSGSDIFGKDVFGRLLARCIGMMLPAFTYTGIWLREKLRSRVAGPCRRAPVSHSNQSPGGSQTVVLASWESFATGCVIGSAKMLSPNMYSFLAS